MKNNKSAPQEKVFAFGFNATPQSIINYISQFPDEFPEDEEINLENIIGHFIILMLEGGDVECEIDNGLRAALEMMEVHYKVKRENKM